MLLRQLQDKQRQTSGADCVQPKLLHKRAATSPPPQQQWATLLIAFILLQHVDIFLCRHIPAASKRLSQGSAAAAADSAAAARIEEPEDSKRSIRSGQLEEIFNVGDRMDENYDEYPMIVPKRAALLLDRLMVALHHALEKERRKISDFYDDNNKNNNYNSLKVNSKLEPTLKSIHANANVDDELDPNNANHMYSDDDPTVIMDYDFKDLNSINRATGETLMAKSFQRRANMGLDLGGDVGAEGVAMLTAAAAAADDVSGINGGGVAGDGVGGGGGRSGIGNGGRMYWRCYFNAVSCF